MKYRDYTARVEYDDEAGVLFGVVEGLRDVVTFEASDVAGLRDAFRASVDDYLAMCGERGESAETPKSGRFLVRCAPDLHRAVATEAARVGKSLNAVTVEALQGWLASRWVATNTHRVGSAVWIGPQPLLPATTASCIPAALPESGEEGEHG